MIQRWRKYLVCQSKNKTTRQKTRIFSQIIYFYFLKIYIVFFSSPHI